MKKTYINPNMKVVKIQMHQHLLDASNPQVGFDRNADAISAGSVEGRYFDFDED